MSKIFGEEHFIEEDMISLVRSEIDNKIDKMVFDKMQQTINLQLPEIKINEDKLRNWVVLCMKLENIEHSDLIDIATKKKFADLQQQLAEKDKNIEELKTKLETAEYWNKKYDNAVEEIEELKFEKRNLSGLIEKVSSKGQQEIRHQVCEEIKDLAGNYFDMPICENCGEQIVLNDVVLTGNDLIEILNQIEKGEE